MAVACARPHVLVACMLTGIAAAQPQDEALKEPRDVRRMGAYQCLECVAGGFLTGIRQGGYGRVLREFPPYRRLCVASYKEIEGEQYVFFQLEPMGAATGGAWSTRRERRSAGTSASGERYTRITLDDGGWPDGGRWGLKSNSWNAECHDATTK